MNRSAANFLFPALAFSVDGRLSVMDDLRASPSALSKRFFDGLFVSDVSGMGHQLDRIGGARPRSNSLFAIRSILGLPIEVQLFVAQSAFMPLPDVQARVVRSIERDRLFWEASGDPARLIARVRAASSFHDVICLIREGQTSDVDYCRGRVFVGHHLQ